MPGSAPFHLKVTFHALPGFDYSPKGKPEIISGTGSYDEIWASPERWRREVTLSNYHAVEIRADGKRTFQASADYEPSRVMMLMSALLDPIPRRFLEPYLDEKPIGWKLEHLTTAGIPWVRVSYRYQRGPYGPEVRAYDFLSTGVLVRREDDYTGLLFSWQDDRPFAGKLVPGHLSVQGAGLDGQMVTADIKIEPLLRSEDTISQVSDAAAAPGMTLRPLEIPLPAFSHFEAPAGASTNHPYPALVRTSVIAVIDRHGMPREVELSSVRNYGQRISREDEEEIRSISERMVTALRKCRWHSPEIDASPCQAVTTSTMGGETQHF